MIAQKAERWFILMSNALHKEGVTCLGVELSLFNLYDPVLAAIRRTAPVCILPTFGITDDAEKGSRNIGGKLIWNKKA